MNSDSERAGKGGVSGIAFNIQRFSIEDGPGIRTTVFMKGCPLKCVWCHNPEGISKKPQLIWYDVRCIGARDCLSACPKGALELAPKGMLIDRENCDACGLCETACPAGALEVIGKEYSPEQVFEEVMRDEVFYRNSEGGVTVGGGEPASQPGFVRDLLVLCREAGIHTALDTCGYAPRDVMEELAGLSDMVLLDLKMMDRARHRETVGADLDRILDNATMISDTGKPLWVRTPVIPGYTDSEENIRGVAEFISGQLPSVTRYDLLAFNNTCGAKYGRLGMEWELEGVPLMTRSTMERLARVAGESGLDCVHWSGATRREG